MQNKLIIIKLNSLEIDFGEYEMLTQFLFRIKKMNPVYFSITELKLIFEQSIGNEFDFEEAFPSDQIDYYKKEGIQISFEYNAEKEPAKRLTVITGEKYDNPNFLSVVVLRIHQMGFNEDPVEYEKMYKGERWAYEMENDQSFLLEDIFNQNQLDGFSENGIFIIAECHKNMWNEKDKK